MGDSKGPIRGLGEVVLTVEDGFEEMVKFYGETLGLEVAVKFLKQQIVETGPFDAVFFKVAGGYGGHGQIFGLLDAKRERPAKQRGFSDEQNARFASRAMKMKVTPTHYAFEISLEDLESEQKRLQDLGLHVEQINRPWIHWRSLYFNDPDGNQVEFVCYDESV